MNLSDQLDHLFICYDNKDVDDSRLADEIALAAMPFCEPVGVRIEELALANHRTEVLHKATVQSSIRLGPRILILSRALAEDAKNGPQVLANFLGSKVQHRLRLPVYCISREKGSNSVGTLGIHAQVRENVTIHCAETDLALILTELRDYFTDARSIRPTYWDLAFATWRYAFIDLRASIAHLLSKLLVLVSSAGQLTTLPLAFVWWKHWYPSWWLWLIGFSAFASGILLHQLRPNDLWPYMLGSWKLPRLAPTKRLYWRGPTIGVTNPSFILLAFLTLAVCQRRVGRAVLWIVVGIVVQTLIDWWFRRVTHSRGVYSDAASRSLLHLTQELSPESCVSSSELELFVYLHGSGDYVNRVMLLLLYAWMTPAVVLALHSGIAGIEWITVGLIAGYMAPCVLAKGLRDRHLAATERFALGGSYATKLGQPLRPRLDPFGSQVRSRIQWPPRLKLAFESFPQSESEWVSLWWRRLRQPDERFGTAFVRPLRTPADYVFVSYAWLDDPDRRTTIQIAEACRAAGIDCFLDKTNLGIGREYFRAELAAAIGKATHFLLVITGNIATGHTVMREIESNFSQF